MGLNIASFEYENPTLQIVSWSGGDSTGIKVNHDVDLHSTMIIDSNGGETAPYFFLAPGHIGITLFSSRFTARTSTNAPIPFEINGYNLTVDLFGYSFSKSDWSKLWEYCGH